MSEHAGINKPPPSAWVAVVLMIVGFLICTIAFVWDNNIPLWIIGGVLGAMGIVMAKLCNIMESAH